MMRLVTGITLAALLAAASGVARADVEGSAEVRAALAAKLESTVPIVIEGQPLDDERVRALYAARANAPLWVGERGDALARVLADAHTHGLDAAEYHVTSIALRSGSSTPDQLAERDLLLTNGLLRYARDVHRGRIAPRHRTEDADLDVRQLDPAGVVEMASGADDVQAFLDELPPHNPRYLQLRELLVRYRRLAAEGGWPMLPDGPKLTPGGADPSIPVLRRQLVATGDLVSAASESTVYDEHLAAAVAAFQRRHGLVADGVIGAATRAALGIDVTARVDQIVANLERWRWFPDELGERYVQVNIADYSLELVEHGVVTLSMPVVVGRRDRMTPILASHITRLTFNPSWTVPETIARKDMLAKVRRNVDYFASEGIRVYSRSNRFAVDPATVDWEATGIMSFLLRQPPGPSNPLGRVRFDFPNVNAVYLHDSPSRSYFTRPVRAFSSGCIRVGRALDLAERLLSETPGWSSERRDAILGAWRTRDVTLGTPVPLYVVYQTAWLDEAGIAHFRGDVYGRDRRLVEAMQRRPTPSAAPARMASRPPIT